MPAIRLGLMLPPSEMGPAGPVNLSFERLAALAQEAEAAGYHSVWWPDHYFIEMGPNGAPAQTRQGPDARRGSFECLTVLTALAMRTSSIRLGSMVVCNTFRHPAILAKEAASLQEMSHGRFILGLGAGWHVPEYEALGLAFDHRVGRLEETATILRELFDTGTSSFKGRWLKLDDADLTPRPAQKIPLLIAAAQTNMLHLTARHADAWNLAWFGGDPSRFVSKVGELHAACADVGRPPEAIELTVGMQAYLTEQGGDAAIAEARAALPHLAGQESEQIRRGLLVGSTEEVAASMRQYAAAGARLAIIGFPGLSNLSTDSAAVHRLLHELPAALA